MPSERSHKHKCIKEMIKVHGEELHNLLSWLESTSVNPLLHKHESDCREPQYPSQRWEPYSTAGIGHLWGPSNSEDSVPVFVDLDMNLDC